jgi:hypothetical protein
LAKNLKLTDKVTISSGTTSTAFPLQGTIPLAIVTPAGLASTSITFQCSLDGSSFYDLYNGSSAYSLTVAASRYISLNPDVFEGVRYVRIVTGSSETAKDIYIVSGER